MAAYCCCRDLLLSCFLPPKCACQCSHLGSVMPAVCLTRPQYVLRSYCDSGSSRLPGSEADMLRQFLFLVVFVRWVSLSGRLGRKAQRGLRSGTRAEEPGRYWRGESTPDKSKEPATFTWWRGREMLLSCDSLVGEFGRGACGFSAQAFKVAIAELGSRCRNQGTTAGRASPVHTLCHPTRLRAAPRAWNAILSNQAGVLSLVGHQVQQTRV